MRPCPEPPPGARRGVQATATSVPTPGRRHAPFADRAPADDRMPRPVEPHPITPAALTPKLDQAIALAGGRAPCLACIHGCRPPRSGRTWLQRHHIPPIG